jgi:D-alanyl-D-alanine dipeptidase
VWGAAALLASTSITALAQTTLPPGFVYLRHIDPTIVQDIRYAGSDNFVGHPLAGYDAPECILRRVVAVALKQVQADLLDRGLALKVYDCYRPQRAVRAMAQWANDGRAGGRTKRFFPRLKKSNLFAGYIAARSRHSTGLAVDLTLIEAARVPAAAFDPAASYAPCTGTAAQRAPDDGVDMGTGYDCLDINSHTTSAAISAEARHWRTVLVAAMSKHGFRNYYREWWHFEHAGPSPGSYHDFLIRPASANVPPD